MEAETRQQLAECLQDSDSIPQQKADYRKLAVGYICLADKLSEHLCTRFSPGPSGNCSLRYESVNNTCICSGGIS